MASVNEYMILKELGKGSFAEVKLCKRTSSVMSSFGAGGSMDEKAEDKGGDVDGTEDSKELYVSRESTQIDGSRELYVSRERTHRQMRVEGHRGCVCRWCVGRWWELACVSVRHGVDGGMDLTVCGAACLCGWWA